jgi:Kdo2-lipid IVA lauroyltransferase/acyltransferase
MFKTRSYLVTQANLELCFPDMSEVERGELARVSLKSTGQTLMETPVVWLSKPKTLTTWIERVVNEELLDVATGAGKGVIVLLPHIGNWELFNVYFAGRGKMTALYQPPRQVYLQELIEDIRSRFGNEMVPTNVKGIARLYKVLQAGGVVTILPDQVPANGLFVPFFGVEALTDQLVSRLVQKTGATVVAVSVIRLENGRFEIVVQPGDEGIYSPEIEASVTAVNKTVEKLVINVPEQYQWEYKRFRKRPKGEKKMYRFGKSEGIH